MTTPLHGRSQSPLHAFYRTPLHALGAGAVQPGVPLTGTCVQWVSGTSSGNRFQLECTGWQDSTGSDPDFGPEPVWLMEFDATSEFQNLTIDAAFNLTITGLSSGATYVCSANTSEYCRFTSGNNNGDILVGNSADGELDNSSNFWPNETVQGQVFNSDVTDNTRFRVYGFYYIQPPLFTQGEAITMTVGP